MVSWLSRQFISWLEFNIHSQHKYGYIRDNTSGMDSYPYPVKEEWKMEMEKSKKRAQDEEV